MVGARARSNARNEWQLVAGTAPQCAVVRDGRMHPAKTRFRASLYQRPDDVAAGPALRIGLLWQFLPCSGVVVGFAGDLSIVWFAALGVAFVLVPIGAWLTPGSQRVTMFVLALPVAAVGLAVVAFLAIAYGL
jgi:hypothetical protein